MDVEGAICARVFSKFEGPLLFESGTLGLGLKVPLIEGLKFRGQVTAKPKKLTYMKPSRHWHPSSEKKLSLACAQNLSTLSLQT